MRTMIISLSQQISRIQQAVETGAYALNSKVLRDDLRLWEQREEIRFLELEQLKKALPMACQWSGRRVSLIRRCQAFG